MSLKKGKSVTFLVGCVVIYLLVPLALTGGKTNSMQQLSPEIQTALNEANRDFTYYGNPIHPKLINVFETWVSDNSTSVTVSVDITAAAKARNEYDTSLVVMGNNRVRVNNSGDTGFYEYERIGTLKNGLHVLRTYDCSGGSGVFQSLFFVRFSIDTAYDRDGKSYERLLMTVVGEFLLGDRDNSTVEVRSDEVIISSSKYRSEPAVLEFE